MKQQKRPKAHRRASLKVRLGHVRTWIYDHPKAIVIASVIFGLLAAATILAFVIFYREPTPTAHVPTTPKPKPVKKAPAPRYYSALTGLEVADDAATKTNVTAIMIENSPDARPQSGLQQADVVYEAIAEGGITRFAALYQQNRPELIGPVRSLRMYYIDWIAPYDPSIAHVGGSLYALREVRNGSHKDIDQFFNAGSYWRSTDRYAPHNVYTSFAKLDALNASKGFTQAAPQTIPRNDSLPAGQTANQVNMTISGPLYNSTWSYDTNSKTYFRSQAGTPHLDREKGQISAQVVVALNMQMDTIMEDGWRENYHTAGAGEATIFWQGQAVPATWHKENMSKQLFFTNKQDGKELPLPRGKTWLTAIPANDGGGVSWQ